MADEITANTQGVLEYLGGKYDTDCSCRSVLTDMRQDFFAFFSRLWLLLPWEVLGQNLTL